MEQKIENLLSAGLQINFIEKDFIQIVVKGTAIWWAGETFQEAYDLAVDKKYVNAPSDKTQKAGHK